MREGKLWWNYDTSRAGYLRSDGARVDESELRMRFGPGISLALRGYEQDKLLTLLDSIVQERTQKEAAVDKGNR